MSNSTRIDAIRSAGNFKVARNVLTPVSSDIVGVVVYSDNQAELKISQDRAQYASEYPAAQLTAHRDFNTRYSHRRLRVSRHDINTNAIATGDDSPLDVFDATSFDVQRRMAALGFDDPTLQLDEVLTNDGEGSTLSYTLTPGHKSPLFYGKTADTPLNITGNALLSSRAYGGDYSISNENAFTPQGVVVANSVYGKTPFAMLEWNCATHSVDLVIPDATGNDSPTVFQLAIYPGSNGKFLTADPQNASILLTMTCYAGGWVQVTTISPDVNPQYFNALAGQGLRIKSTSNGEFTYQLFDDDTFNSISGYSGVMGNIPGNYQFALQTYVASGEALPVLPTLPLVILSSPNIAPQGYGALTHEQS